MSDLDQVVTGKKSPLYRDAVYYLYTLKSPPTNFGLDLTGFPSANVNTGSWSRETWVKYTTAVDSLRDIADTLTTKSGIRSLASLSNAELANKLPETPKWDVLLKDIQQKIENDPALKKKYDTAIASIAEIAKKPGSNDDAKKLSEDGIGCIAGIITRSQIIDPDKKPSEITSFHLMREYEQENHKKPFQGSANNTPLGMVNPVMHDPAFDGKVVVQANLPKGSDALTGKNTNSIS